MRLELVDGLSSAARLFTFSLPSSLSTKSYTVKTTAMSFEKSILISSRRISSFRLSNVSGHKIDLLEIKAEDPTWHVMFVPGNPGAISFYIDFLENLFGVLGETASITAIGHISLTEKIDFINHELQDIKVPIVLVGHSIGSHMSLEIFRACPEKVAYCIGLYPFLAVNKASSEQSYIKRLAMSPILSGLVASAAGLLDILPKKASRFFVTNSVGKSWSSTAVEAVLTHLLKYHIVRNVLFLAMTEFKTLPETPDWEFLREKENQIAFLFGSDDHWGPLHMFEEISRNVPNVALAIEGDGHTHAFCCTKAGSLWAAQHVASLIKNFKTN